MYTQKYITSLPSYIESQTPCYRYSQTNPTQRIVRKVPDDRTCKVRATRRDPIATWLSIWDSSFLAAARILNSILISGRHSGRRSKSRTSKKVSLLPFSLLQPSINLSKRGIILCKDATLNTQCGAEQQLFIFIALTRSPNPKLQLYVVQDQFFTTCSFSAIQKLVSTLERNQGNRVTGVS